jgi:hypothetical protein
MTIWYILSSSGAFFPVLVSCSKENLATLIETAAFFKSRRKVVAILRTKFYGTS